MRISFSSAAILLLAALAMTDASAQARYSFDSSEDFFAPASSWPAWQAMLDRHQLERASLFACIDDENACPRRLRGLRHVLVKGADLSLEQQVKLVNRYISRQRYVDERVSSTALDGNHFETLTEFLQTGGDCEDFAVAKYLVLREFGVPAENMRIVVGKEPRRTEHHAVLAINTGNEVLLLENDNRIYRNGRQDMNRFVYAINEAGIWDHEQTTH